MFFFILAHFVHQSGTNLGVLVESHLSNIPRSLNEIGWGYRKSWSLKIFLYFFFYFWRPSFLSEQNDFSYFGSEPSRYHSCEV